MRKCSQYFSITVQLAEVFDAVNGVGLTVCQTQLQDSADEGNTVIVEITSSSSTALQAKGTNVPLKITP